MVRAPLQTHMAGRFMFQIMRKNATLFTSDKEALKSTVKVVAYWDHMHVMYFQKRVV